MYTKAGSNNSRRDSEYFRPNNSKVMTIFTTIGDCQTFSNTIRLEECVKGVMLELPDIPGADVSFLGNPQDVYGNSTTFGLGPEGQPAWIIGDKDCKDPDQTFTVQWQACVTDLTIVSGTYSVTGYTSTTEDTGNNIASITIEVKKKPCPEVEVDPPAEECGVIIEEQICYENPVKPVVKDKIVRVRPIIGRPPVATKRKVSTKQKIDNCPNDVSIS